MIYFIVIIAILIVIISFSIIYGWVKLKPFNQRPFNIETFDGLNSPFSSIFYRNGLYRSCLVKNKYYKLYFSAYDSDSAYLGVA